MVYVRLIREEAGKTICENLHLNPMCYSENGTDQIVLSNDWNVSDKGYRVTQEDF